MLKDQEGRGSVLSQDLSEIYRQVHAYALRLCRRAKLAEDTADEITQDTFERYFSKQRRSDITDDVALLFTIAHDLWVDRCRKRSREMICGATRDEDVRPSQCLDPQQNVLNSEALHKFKQAVNKLTLINQRIAFCRVFLDLSWQQIGDLVGLSESAVQGRWLNTICPRLQRHFWDDQQRYTRKRAPALLALAGIAAAAALSWLRDHLMIPAAKLSTVGAITAGVFLLPFPAPPEEPAPPSPPERDIIDAGPTVQDPATMTVTPAEPRPSAAPPESTPSPSSPPLRAPDTPSRHGEAIPPRRTHHGLYLDPDPSRPGRKEADSREIETPYGTITAGGDAHTTGPIGQSPLRIRHEPPGLDGTSCEPEC